MIYASKNLRIVLCVLSLSLLGSALAENAVVQPFKVWNEVPNSELKKFKAPVAERFELPNGMVVFLLEDHELPLIDLSMTLRFGDVHEPADMTGIADATASIMRTGGSVKYPGDKLDLILEDLAASVGVGIGTDSGSASLNILKDDFDKGLDILADVLRNPAFPDDKIDLYLAQARTNIAKRNDNPSGICMREFRKAVYGEKSPYVKITQYATLNKIDKKALQNFHDQYFHPNMFIMGVVGDFKKDDMIAKLKTAFGDWPKQEVTLPKVEPIAVEHQNKVLFVDLNKPKLPQTTFLFGHVVDIHRDNPDYPAIQMMNEVLSGGMAARIFTEVRTKKGLAYSAYGQASINYNRPGLFYCMAQTRHEQAVECVEAVKEEVTKMKEHGITEKELAEAKESILNSFVFNFDTPAKVIGRQMTYEFYHYPMDFAEKLLESIKKVGVDDVNRVAAKYLDPANVILLAAGNTPKQEGARGFRTVPGCQIVDITIPPPQPEVFGTDAQRESDGRKAIAECLAAAGGADAFKEIKSLREDLLLTVKGMKLNGSLRMSLPGKARLDFAGPTAADTQIVSGDVAWTAAGATVQDAKAADVKQNLRTLLQSDLLVMRALAADPYKVQALDGAENGVEIESESLGRFKLWFDPKSHLIVKLKPSPKGLAREYEKSFGEPTAFGNLTLAKLITNTDPAGPEQISVKALLINPVLEDALFTKPEKATPPPDDLDKKKLMQHVQHNQNLLDDELAVFDQ